MVQNFKRRARSGPIRGKQTQEFSWTHWPNAMLIVSGGIHRSWAAFPTEDPTTKRFQYFPWTRGRKTSRRREGWQTRTFCKGPPRAWECDELHSVTEVLQFNKWQTWRKTMNNQVWPVERAPAWENAASSLTLATAQHDFIDFSTDGVGNFWINTGHLSSFLLPCHVFGHNRGIRNIYRLGSSCKIQ